MVDMQKTVLSSVSLSTNGSSYGSCMTASDAVVSDQFPVGLRVLVVDDDVVCLRILEQMLRRCMYHVTTCSQAVVALNILRERKGCFDVVLSDVHMPDMDGFILLERVGLNLDLPVIMMSGDGSTNTVMKGIRHGACDYLIKPIREEELKNIWQHVVRKKWNGNKELEHSGCLDNDQHKQETDDAEYASSFNEESDGILKGQKKRSNAKEEDDDELESEDPSTSKKPRVVWSVELHQQFVGAVNQLGIDKAVPKRILELMNVPGLTRENVASHLQKFRLYLKRLSGVAQQHSGVSKSFCGPVESNVKLNSLGGYDIQALAAAGHIPPQTLAALHAELLGQPTGSLMLPALDQPAQLQASPPGPKCIPVEHGLAFGQPGVKCQSNISKRFPLSFVSDASSGFGAWPPNTIVTVGPSSNLGGLNTQSNMLMSVLQQQQPPQKQQWEHQKQHQQTHQSILPECSRTISVQPSCLVVSSPSSTYFQPGSSPTSVNQSCSFNRSGITESLLAPQSHNSSLNFGKICDAYIKTTFVLSGYHGAASVSPSLSSCSANADNSSSRQIPNSMITYSATGQLPGLVPNNGDNQGAYGAKPGEAPNQTALRNLGFVGKGTCIPSRFAVDELDGPTSNLNLGFAENTGSRVKQEPNLDFMENAKAGIPLLQHFSSNDLMSVLTE